jgi:hypothetical protein
VSILIKGLVKTLSKGDVLEVTPRADLTGSGLFIPRLELEMAEDKQVVFCGCAHDFNRFAVMADCIDRGFKVCMIADLSITPDRGEASSVKACEKLFGPESVVYLRDLINE